MKITDSIYGEFQVEAILEKLINTKEMQRLKGVHQGGASYLINPKWNVTRYDHSIGTMLLIRSLGGSIEEQIAGLLHDISHTAFSHVIDFVFKNSNEDYHEEIYNEIVEASEIPKILEENGYDYKDILFNESKWTILERKAPKLCGDRVDYTLRDMYHYGYITKDEINDFLKDLTVFEGEIVVNSVEAGEWLCGAYYKETVGFFMNLHNVYANDRLSKALKIAVDLKEVSLEDLVKEDDVVYDLLRSSSSLEVIELIDSINMNVKLTENKESYDIFQRNKTRLIDPTVVVDGKCFSTSEKSDVVKMINERTLKKSEEGVFIEIHK
ncbi:MAG: HD domain-containing protein [Clostridium sp.]